MDNFMNLRLAVLIDAENVPRGSIKEVLEEIAIYGTPTIKRIYGDWTNPYVAGWKNKLVENAITPIQQYSYTQGKNSSDSAMIIDAMDILYTNKTDGFVIVSSDSDFTRLAVRLREAGQRVIGIGERKTPSAFIAACDKFTYIEAIRKQHNISATNGTDTASDDSYTEHFEHKKHIIPNGIVPDDIIELIANSISDIADDNGLAFLGELGNLLLKKQPDFDHRNYGYKTLTAMIKSIDRFEMEFRQTADPNIKHVFVRDKENHQ
ncbi:MAG: NYN domain-containing protein [Oscillospiraceae bacterium]|jgi:uncharacterized LabA/DUF88 family protein|nr:NYN domain-containing protein [Oscillospiraceae bacterium]